MKPILGYYAFLLLILVLLIVLTWISIARPKMTQESMADGSGSGSGTGSYLLSHVQVKESPKESWEKLDTVGSAGEYSTALYDLKIHSREKIDCIAPGVYNRDTFECDCPEGYDYSAVYGCISKCQPFQKYVPYDDGRGGGYCVNICNPGNLDASQNTYYDAVQDACLKCSFDTYNDGNNNCIPRAACPSGAQYVDDSGECKKCLVGQVFNDQNACVAACPSFQIMRNGVCEPRCPLQYQYWNDGGAAGSGVIPSCMNCPTGYVANALNQCVPSSVTCRPGEHYDATHTCVSVCLDHEKWNSELGNCIPKCSDTQRYDAKLNGCVYCPMGQHANEANGCVAPPVTPAPTPSCPAGFKLDSTFTACETVCPYWRYNAEDDPTACELLCPIQTQYYEKDINNGCVNCPVGYIADPNNQCTMCDTDNGYIMDSMGRCTFECQSYQTWNAVTDVCDYNCPDNNTYYVPGKGCQYCPDGYLVDQNNQCSLCDTDKGYVASGDKCVQQCLPWQRWDNKHKKCVYHCQSESQVYDLENEVCVTCQQLHDNHYILGTNRDTNQCQVGGIFTKAPVVVPPAIVNVPPANVNVPRAPTVTPTPAATPSLSVTLTELRDTGATLSITSNYDGNIVLGNSVVGSFKAGAAAQSVAASFTLTESPVDLHVTLLNANGQTLTGSGTSKVVSILPKTSNNTFTVSPSNYLYQVNYTLVGGGGGGGSGASTGDSGSTGCTGGGGGAGQSISGTYTLPGYTNSVGVQLTTGLGGAGGAPVTGSGGANGGAGQTTALKLSNGTVINQAAGGGGGAGGGAGSNNDCSGGPGGASGDPANSSGKGINGNDWRNSDYGRARGGTNSSGSGSGGHGGVGGQSGASGSGEGGGNGAGTFTAKYYAVSVQ